MFAVTRLTLSLAVLVLGSQFQIASAQTTTTVDAGRGPVTVHIPSTYDPESPMPLVMLLHGYTSSGPGIESYINLAPLSESYGFLYLYPSGTVDSGGNRFWNATPACCDFNNSNVDDSGYLLALIDLIKESMTVDSNRVFVGGHSNGGFMAYRMACEHADTIAAIASLAGATYIGAAQCTPSEPLDVLQIHGTSDTTISYNGGNIAGSGYPSAVGSCERWATNNGCSLVVDSSAPNMNLAGNIAGAETTVMRWTDSCNAGGSAELWSIQGGSHVPFFNGNFRVELIEWFLAHPKTGLGSRYCTPNANSSGAASRISAAGSLSVGNNDLVLSAASVPANVNGIFFYGPMTNSVPLGNGVLCIAPGGGVGLFRLPLVNSGASSLLQVQPDLLNPPTQGGLIQPGDTWKFQAWFRDSAAGGAMFNLSDALSLSFEP
ncbi:MAG: polyhydroxybutyrate depolymerase [Planctomycetota bacterium]|jgi:polyhydroxybutyrate depolymerase